MVDVLVCESCKKKFPNMDKARAHESSCPGFTVTTSYPIGYKIAGLAWYIIPVMWGIVFFSSGSLRLETGLDRLSDPYVILHASRGILYHQLGLLLLVGSALCIGYVLGKQYTSVVQQHSYDVVQQHPYEKRKSSKK